MDEIKSLILRHQSVLLRLARSVEDCLGGETVSQSNLSLASRTTGVTFIVFESKSGGISDVCSPLHR